jgi:hypothetical protein
MLENSTMARWGALPEKDVCEAFEKPLWSVEEAL